MIAYIVRRLLMAVFTTFIISILSFFIIQLPEGDTVDRHMDNLGGQGFSDTSTDSDAAQALRNYLGLDEAMHIRYYKWMWNLLQGDFGLSFQFHCSSFAVERTVKEIIGDRVWLTITLTGFTAMVTWTFAFPVGIYSAVRQHSIGDYAFTLLGFSGIAVPDFLLGLVLMYVAFAYFDQSVGGLFSGDFMDSSWSLAKVWDLFKHLWIPAIVLGTSGTASLIRIMRNNLLDELGKPYVATARAKGVTSWKLIVKYPVRVAINPS
jgi:peptide/nickel transport system permease protein